MAKSDRAAKWLDRRIARPGPYLTLCTTEAEYLAAIRDIENEYPVPWVSNGADATTHFYDNDNKQTVAIVCIRNTGDHTPVEVAGLLVHEEVHVWQQYCLDIGERSPGMEQEAYAIQSISQELMDAYAAKLR